MALMVCSFPIFLHLCLSYDCVLTANPLRTHCGPVFTVFLCCTDGCVVIFFVSSVISRLYHFWRLQPLVCGLLSCLLHGQNSSDGISVCHAVCLGFSFNIVILGFSTGQAFAYKCYGPKHCISGHFISLKPYSIPKFQNTCSKTHI